MMMEMVVPACLPFFSKAQAAVPLEMVAISAFFMEESEVQRSDFGGGVEVSGGEGVASE
jgi:hypothetical protein